MTTNQIVIEINNVACDLLERGHHQEASRLFKKALQILQCSSKGETASTKFVKDSVLKQLSQINRQCALPRSTPSSNHGLAIYDRSFKMPKNQDATASTQLPLENTVRLIYNLALSVHLWAMEDGLALSSQKIQQALKQYGNTRKILASMLQDQEDALLPVLMATLNNEAQLCCENCQHDRSIQCLESLARVLLKSDSIASTKVRNMDNEIFHLNVITFKIGSTVPRPRHDETATLTMHPQRGVCQSYAIRSVHIFQ